MDHVNKRPTITDVAREAGVSVATVSYVLSGKRPIGQDTRGRVLDVIARLKYRPNPNAQGLKAKRSNLLNVTVSDWRESSISAMIRGIEAAAKAKGIHLLVNSCEEFDNDLAAVFEHAARKRVDGLLLASGIAGTEPIHGPWAPEMPVVAMNRPLSTAVPAVLCDNADGGYQAAEHLLLAGARCPAVIAGPSTRSASTDRVDGFRRGLNDHGVELPPELVFQGDFEAESGVRGLITLRKRRPSVDALFCTNDAMAAGVAAEALRSGIRIPADLLLIGFNNHKFTTMFPVPISSFALPLEEMGRAATNALITYIETGVWPFSRLLVRSTLHPRASTGYSSRS